MHAEDTSPRSPTPNKEDTDSKDEHALLVDETPNPTLNYAEYVSRGEGLDSVARCDPDGRISLVFDFKSGTPDISQDHAQDVEEFAVDRKEWSDCPKMNIVIMIVGSRGDVQPYVALGQQLLKDGHRVRIATHETFRQFVTDAGLEFFNIGGNPQDLMSYMVKNPGLIPGFDSLKNGDIVKKRKMLAEMIHGCWDSCHLPCPVSGRAFAADAIISNPPAFAHIHCAEALGIPLLLSFTMPWSPTVAFAHPLVNITTNAGSAMSNYLSYAAAELLTWQGVGDIINTFRTSKLGLSPLNIRSGPGYVDRLKVPWTYCMSPALIPKPEDWKNHIDVTGFYFLNLANSYQPPPELSAFLAAGETPVYIGFGSVVVDDPTALSHIIFDATKEAGVRALVSAGWGGLGGTSLPPHIFMLGNIPHDWLFDQDRVSAVIHHGGAGTTAIGLANGRPTVVVPFFGDQGFWGSMIYKAGAGPEPIPYKELTVSKLKKALRYAISPEAKAAAAQMARKIHEENGVHSGVNSFYKHLPLLNMRCDLDPARLAVWWSKEQCLKLSAFAAQTLADAKLISLKSLVLHRPKEYSSRKKAPNLSGGASAMFWSLTNQTKIGGVLQSAIDKADNAYASTHSILDAMNTMHEGLRGHGSPSTSRVNFEGSSFSKGKSVAGNLFTSYDGSKRETMKREGLIDTIKHLVSRKRPPIDLATTVAVQGTWKLLQTSSGKTNYNRQRLTRIAEGRSSVRNSTKAQRANIIERFQTETSTTPIRQKLYRNAWVARGQLSTDLSIDSNKNPIIDPEGLSAVSTVSQGQIPETICNSGQSIPGMPYAIPPQSEALDDDNETTVFISEMELAMKLSVESYERNFMLTPHAHD